MLFKSKDHSIEVNSIIAHEFHNICKQWLQCIDLQICKNLSLLTCNDIKDIYFALWCELKHWRSSSGNFTGFSELVLFRSLYHAIGEEFKPIETGDSRDPIKFESENYEIGQSIKIEVNGKKKSPDIYIKRNNQLISIIQVKIFVDDDSKIGKEVETFELFKSEFPTIKGLFIVFNKSGFNKKREEMLRKAGYATLVLQGNSELIYSVLSRFV